MLVNSTIYRLVPGRYHDFGIDSIPSMIPKSIDSIPSTCQTALIVLYPICFNSCRPNSNETRVPHLKAEIFQRKKKLKGGDFALKTKKG